jgi:hypothetical protein
MSTKKLLLLVAIGSLSMVCRAQDTVKITRDTIYIEPQDTVLIKSYAERYNPRKALLYAAVIPGLGQVYNKKYWKIPLVYGGFYWIWSYVDKNNGYYKTYKEHLFYNLEHNLAGPTGINPTTKITTANLRRIVDRARRERDFYVILMGGMYLLQMVDAHVDAHLKEFDLNPNLHAKIKPTFTQDAMVGRFAGVSLKLRF